MFHPLLPTLNLLFNTLTYLDKEIWAPLAPHSNKILCISFLPWNKEFYFRMHERLYAIAPQNKHKVDLFLEGNLSAFYSHRGIHIKGDVGYARALLEVFNKVDLDVEGELAKLFGKNMAYLLSHFFRQTWFTLQKVIQARQEDTMYYLQDEKKFLVGKSEIEEFFNDVDILRDDVSRFSAKINLLRRQLKGKEV